MQRTNKVNETINRGITAVAMTVAIATLYSAVATEGQLSQGDGLRQQIETVLKQSAPELQIAQDAEDSSPENLATFVSSASSSTYNHQ